MRLIRNIASAFFLTATIALAALWIRSHYSFDEVMQTRGDLILSSWDGEFTLILAHGRAGNGSLRVSSIPAKEFLDSLRRDIGPSFRPQEYFGFAYKALGASRVVIAPHWFFVTAAIGLSVILKPKPRLQFSMQYLLIAMAFAAMIAAAVAALARLRA
jgi:hypothetical protein